MHIKNLLLAALLLMGMTISTDGTEDEQQLQINNANHPISLIQDQNKAYVHTLYLDSVEKDKEISQLKNQVEEIESELSGVEVGLNNYPDNPRLNKQKEKLQIFLKETKNKIETRYSSLIKKFKEICDKENIGKELYSSYVSSISCSPQVLESEDYSLLTTSISSREFERTSSPKCNALILDRHRDIVQAFIQYTQSNDLDAKLRLGHKIVAEIDFSIASRALKPKYFENYYEN